MNNVIYGSFSCNIKPNKEETHLTRLTAGGDRINYPKDVGTPTADMTLVKTLLNSIILTNGATFVMLDVKDFYLNTPMEGYKYMHLKLSDIPEEILIEYELHEIATSDGYVYCKIRKGMYGLPQAGIIAQELLQERLAKVGYHQSKIVPGLWTHETRNTCFTLVVDNFAIKYTKMGDAKHLVNALQKDYTITVDWDATKYIGLTIEWDYKNQKVYTHMPGYLSKALLRFKHNVPKTKQNSPHPHVAPQYGAKEQYTTEEDTSPLLNKEEAKYVQAVAGTLLYYARVVDNTILHALSAIATEQVKPTEQTKATIKQLLDYCAMQEEPVIAYKASKMILAVHSNGGYCNEKNSRSQMGGHFSLSSNNEHPPQQRSNSYHSNDHKSGHVISCGSRIRSTISQRRRGSICTTKLTEMGHPQPQTPI
jgi:hypothetical protein